MAVGPATQGTDGLRHGPRRLHLRGPVLRRKQLPVIFYNRTDRKANTLTVYMKTFTLTSKFTFSSAYRGYTPASPSGAMAPGARTPRLCGVRPGTWVEGLADWGRSRRCRWGGRGLGLPRELLTGIPEERATSPAYTPPVTGSSLTAALGPSEWRPRPCIEPKSHLPALVTRGSAPGGRDRVQPLLLLQRPDLD